MLGMEALVILSDLSQLMAEKLKEPNSHVRLWINGQIVITIARLYSRMIHGACLLSPLRDWDPDWDPVSVLSLVK